MVPVADKAAHQRKARHNEKFFTLNTTITKGVKSYPDWCIIVIHYAALHYVDAKLAKMNIHPPDHQDRDSLVANNLARGISAAYNFLRNRSETARYFPDSENNFNEHDVRACIDKLHVIEPNTALFKFSTTYSAAFA